MVKRIIAAVRAAKGTKVVGRGRFMARDSDGPGSINKAKRNRPALKNRSASTDSPATADDRTTTKRPLTFKPSDRRDQPIIQNPIRSKTLDDGQAKRWSEVQTKSSRPGRSSSISPKICDFLLTLGDEDKSRLPQRAYRALRHAITHLHLPPGQMFLEREVVEAMNMSRTPVREALVRLEVEGWVHLTPRHGFSVAPILQSDLRDLYEVVENLDGLAGRLAASHITDEQLGQLEVLIKRQGDALEANDLVTWAELDDDFHKRIIASAENRSLRTIMDSHADQIYRARLYTVGARPKPMRSIEEHIAIVAAMRASNGEAAQRLMESHQHRTLKEILDALRTIQGDM
jgi:DNA-binding GntR family transcriptional regulator